ncbi:MAG: LPS biosynthesis protein WbpP [Flavobacteriales bacterium]|nr:LPS biosynthesis protein WbpP [Flavobacteriales bacterium]
MQSISQFSKQIEEASFLVSGGAGFVGSNLVEALLNAGAKKVRVLDNLSNGHLENLKSFESHSNFEFIEGDIVNLNDCRQALEGIDYLSHQAALGSVPRSLKDPIATNKANVDGFLNMITIAREVGVKRVVYASSSSVYGDSVDLPKVEEKIGHPMNSYAVSKLTNELYAHAAHLNYGQEIIGLRYFNIFGPRQSPRGPYAAVIPLFIESILKDQSPFINGDGEQSRDFTFVENAVQANIKAFFAPKEAAAAGVYNVAVGERYTLNQLFSYLKDIVGSDAAAVHREPRDGDIPHSQADISKAQRMLDYQPSVKFKDGLKKTVDWFRKA